MKRTKKRMLWGTVIILLVLVGLGVYSYFIGTRTLLEYAEAFAFRRMVATKLPENDAYRFFYATNRVPRETAGTAAERFQSERGETLSFGFFDTRFEPTLRVGMLIDPSDWFLNDAIKIENVQSLEPAALVDKLREQVQASSHRSLLVVVHGFRERFPSALNKTAFLAHVLDIDTPVLVFDWPGDQGSSLRGYRRARGVAQASGSELAAAIKLIVQDVQPERLWLMANSMGAQVVVDAFHVLYQDAGFSDSPTEIEEVVLTAADVRHEEFNNQFKQEIKALATNVTVYVSSNDRALLVSRLINRGLRLGESTLDPSNPSQVDQAVSLSGLLEAGDQRLALVDVTPVNRTRNFHNFSLETPEFFNDLFLRFTTPDLPNTRELYSVQTPEGVRYFVLTRGR